MEIKSRFDHYNYNVRDLERSLLFYNQALGLKEHHRLPASDGSYIIVYLTDSETSFYLELTWLRDWARDYNLGDNEQHLCLRVANDYGQVRQYHREQGWICFENQAMGIYFIEDPDGYWIEILPSGK